MRLTRRLITALAFRRACGRDVIYCSTPGCPNYTVVTANRVPLTWACSICEDEARRQDVIRMEAREKC